jgi:hypothetical protein
MAILPFPLSTITKLIYPFSKIDGFIKAGSAPYRTRVCGAACCASVSRPRPARVSGERYTPRPSPPLPRLQRRRPLGRAHHAPARVPSTLSDERGGLSRERLASRPARGCQAIAAYRVGDHFAPRTFPASAAYQIGDRFAHRVSAPRLSACAATASSFASAAGIIVPDARV